MGIYDREYYRDETRGSGFFSGAAPACKAIIAVNILVYLADLSWGDQSDLFDALRAHSDQIFRQFRVWQLLTAAFVHNTSNVGHILWNMLFLWWLGRDMEALYGSREFLRMYLTAAVFSTACWAVLDRIIPGGRLGGMEGASGAVMAVVVLNVLYHPRREVLLFFVLPVEAWLLVLVYLGNDALNLLQQLQRGGTGSAAGVAFAAHLGGGLYGYLYKTYDLRWSRLLSRRGVKPRLRIVSPEPRDRVSSGLSTPPARSASAGASRTVPPSSFPEEQLDARLDEVLSKIAREGKSGLTEEDNRILQEASRRARDRRR